MYPLAHKRREVVDIVFNNQFGESCQIIENRQALVKVSKLVDSKDKPANAMIHEVPVPL